MTEQTPLHPNWAGLTEDAEQPWRTLNSRELVGGARKVLEDRVYIGSVTEVSSVPKVGRVIEASYQYRPRGPKAVFVFPVTVQGEAVLIRQYRYPLRATITEVVAGGVEQGEELQSAAQRELMEEVGGQSNDWLALPGFYPQPSMSGVVFYAFVALNVTLGEMHHEETETIERLVLPLPEAYRRLEAGEIQDGPSSLTLWHARRYLQERGLL